MERRASPSLMKDGNVIRCKPENLVPIVAVSKKNLENPMTFRRRWATDCNLQLPDHQKTGREKFFNPVSEARRTKVRHRATDCTSHVPRDWDTDRIMFQNGFNNFSKKASLVDPMSHDVVVEQLVGEPKEKHRLI